MRALFALLAMTTVAAASGVEMNYENLYLEDGRAHIVLRVDTTDDTQGVTIKCAFLNADGRALDTTYLFASRLSAGVPAYAQGRSRQVDGIETASCRVAATR